MEFNEEEAKEMFLMTENCKLALWKFFEKNKPKYFSEHYPDDFKEKVARYWDLIRATKKDEDAMVAQFGNVQVLDRTRSQYHTAAASELVSSGLAPNDSLARLFVHFLSISKGLDHTDFQRDERRRKAMGSDMLTD